MADPFGIGLTGGSVIFKDAIERASRPVWLRQFFLIHQFRPAGACPLAVA